MDQKNGSDASQELNALLGLDKKKRSPKRIAILALAAVVGAAAVGGGVALAVRRMGAEQSAGGAAVQREYTVQRGDVTVGQSESSSISLDRVTVSFPVSAKVEAVYVKAGSSVRAGDPLVKMNLDDIQAGLASYELQLGIVGLKLEQAKLQQQSQLLSAQQKLESSKQDGSLASVTAELEIAQLEAAVNDAQDTLEKKQTELEKWEGCRATLEEDAATLKYYEQMAENHQNDTEGRTWSSILSEFQEYYSDTYGTAIESMEDLEEQVEKTAKELETAQLALEKAELSLKTGKLNITQQKQSAQTGADTAQAEYELTSVELEQAVEAAQETYDELAAQIEEVKALLSDDGVVYAECGGLVASVAVAEGDEVEVFIDEETNIIRAYATLLTMTDLANVYVPITISEEDILNVSIGQEATVTMNAFPNRTFEAEVDTITVESARSGAATVSYTVNVRFKDENDQDMFEGMSAEVTLVQRAARDVLYVNNQAITFQNGVSTVRVKNNDGSTETRRVVTGFTDGRYVEIVSGLEEGETVLVESAVGLK
jgi:multidrug efflux pump subunit AcrA (membrane-fusion protein)